MNYIKKNSKITNKNLVIVRAGNSSLHKSFFYPPDNFPRSWDRMIFAYEDIQEVDHAKAEFIVSGGMSKWTDLSNLINSNFFQEYPYEFILVADDDLLPISDDSINNLFSFTKQFNLHISQPALTHDSHAFWKVTYHSPSFLVRFTNFVEVMCPVFSNHAMGLIKNDVAESVSGCGLDLIFSELLNKYQNSMGIIDAVQFKHTKPIDITGGAFYKHLRKNNIDPDEETRRFLIKYNLKQKSVMTVGGVPFIQEISI